MKPKPKKRINTSLAMIRRYFPKVTSVQDAVRPAIVEVTTNDNEHSDVKSHLTCALAVACKRYFRADGAIIGLTTSWIIKSNLAMRYINSGTTSREITSFDRKAGFDTGQYLLVPATGSSRIGAIRSHKPNRHGNGNGLRRPSFRHYTRNVRATLRTLHP